jgi:chromate reductase
MKVLILSTSTRRGSLTLRFARYLKNEIQKLEEAEAVQIQSFEDFDFPSIGRGKTDPENLSTFQKNLIDSWNEAQVVIICSPEYNWTAGGEFFILTDHLSSRQFSHLFQNKVFAFAGTSSGRGGRLPALEAGKVISKIISFQNQLSVLSPKIFEAHEIGQNLSEESVSTGNPVFESGVRDFARYTMKVARRWIVPEKIA